jgi:hypothetical protein
MGTKAFNTHDSMYLNYTGLMETRMGNGIEAWVRLDEQDIIVF